MLYIFDKPAHPSIIENLKITSYSGSGEMAIVIPVRSLDKGTMIHKLAARSLLEDLEQQSRDPRYYDRHTSASAERIACKWSLVSKWTSFLLTEEQSPTQGGGLMGGIITVRDAAGEDLLRSRGVMYLTESPVPWHTTLEPTSRGLPHSDTFILQQSGCESPKPNRPP